MITEFSVSLRMLKVLTLKRSSVIHICVFIVLLKSIYCMLLQHHFAVLSERKNNQNALQSLKSSRLLDQQQNYSKP